MAAADPRPGARTEQFAGADQVDCWDVVDAAQQHGDSERRSTGFHSWAGDHRVTFRVAESVSAGVSATGADATTFASSGECEDSDRTRCSARNAGEGPGRWRSGDDD